MFKKYELIIKILALVLGTLFIPYTAFSQEGVTENIEAEDFVVMMPEVNKKIADFGDEFQRTKIGDISGVSLPKPLSNIPVDQYVKYGSKTDEGTVIYIEKGIAVPSKTDSSLTYVVRAENESRIRKYLLDQFNNFYEEIATVLIDIGKDLKKSPVRLNSISVEMAPLGIGGSITIEVNYESPIFGED